MRADRCTTIVPAADSTTRIELSFSCDSLGPVEQLHAAAALVEHCIPLRPPLDGALVRPRGAVGKTLRARRGGKRG